MTVPDGSLDVPGPAADPTRRSRCLDDGTFLLHADLHNHSLLSDGSGDPERAFALMREAGLDAAALTDHASIPQDRLAGLSLADYPDDEALATARTAPRSIDAAAWERAARIADAHDAPGSFTALRGFEWTEPWLGHVNVWFSGGFLGVTTPGTLAGLQRWLREAEPEAIYGYNHPGREAGRLEEFARPDDDALAARLVAAEAFNRTHDFLFVRPWMQTPEHPTAASPLARILDLGWRPGLIGCSDEHGRDYGLRGKGRTGLWVHEHSRDGVREALLARRTFATREPGLRLDARLDGVRMGSALPDGAVLGGRHRLRVDLACPGIDGAEVELQLLTGTPEDEIAVLARVPARCGELVDVEVELPAGPGVDGVRWVVLRAADPARQNAIPGPAGHPANAYALAYASPWWPGAGG